MAGLDSFYDENGVVHQATLATEVALEGKAENDLLAYIETRTFGGAIIATVLPANPPDPSLANITNYYDKNTPQRIQYLEGWGFHLPDSWKKPLENIGTLVFARVYSAANIMYHLHPVIVALKDAAAIEEATENDKFAVTAALASFQEALSGRTSLRHRLGLYRGITTVEERYALIGQKANPSRHVLPTELRDILDAIVSGLQDPANDDFSKIGQVRPRSES